MTLGPSWTMAVYANADGLNYNQYTEQCFGAGMMSIDKNSFDKAGAALKLYRESTNDPGI